MGALNSTDARMYKTKSPLSVVTEQAYGIFLEGQANLPTIQKWQFCLQRHGPILGSSFFSRLSMGPWTSPFTCQSAELPLLRKARWV